MTVRAAEHHQSGIRTFYVSSESKPGIEYTVQRIRKPGMNRWQCSCPQFFFRCVRCSALGFLDTELSVFMPRLPVQEAVVVPAAA